jgi:hypothetical protein
VTAFSPTFPLSVGAFVGILLSGGFVWLEVGRYAAPQVPVSLFDERREMFAYTAGLFVGVPIAIVFVLYADSMANGALIGGLLFLALLVLGTEAAQSILLRTRYWGRSDSSPFYALGYRASIGGIMALALVSQYLSIASPVTWDGIALVVVQSFAVLLLEVAGALMSVRSSPTFERRGGGPLSGGAFAAIGFFLFGLGALSGEAGAFLGAALALLGGYLVYQRLRPLLRSIPSPEAGPPLPAADRPAAFGRLDRSEPKK